MFDLTSKAALVTDARLMADGGWSAGK